MHVWVWNKPAHGFGVPTSAVIEQTRRDFVTFLGDKAAFSCTFIIADVIACKEVARIQTPRTLGIRAVSFPVNWNVSCVIQMFIITVKTTACLFQTERNVPFSTCSSSHGRLRAIISEYFQLWCSDVEQTLALLASSSAFAFAVC